MPFVNGKYYMNPSYGIALERERLRADGAENVEPEVVSATDAHSQAGDHWVTIDHRHVLIHDAQGVRLPTYSEFIVVPKFGHEVPVSGNYRTENVRYEIARMDRLGNISPLTLEDGDHRVTLNETFAPESKRTDVYICPSCESTIPNVLIDTMGVTEGRPHAVIKRFAIDGSPARIYDPSLHKAYDFVRADANFNSKSGSFTFAYGNDPQR